MTQEYDETEEYEELEEGSILDMDEIPYDQVALTPEDIENGIYVEQGLPTDKANPDDDGDPVE